MAQYDVLLSAYSFINGAPLVMATIKDFGHIDSIFFAHSSDENIRFRASSGGFIKSFLVYLLESRAVDFVIITRTGDSNKPLVPETIITDSKEDILSTRTNSVYAVNNPLHVLKEVDANKRYAFVGLPCYIRNLKSMQRNGRYRNIVIVISLFCNHTPNIEFTRGILRKLDVKEEELKQIEYRGGGWPGGLTAHLKNGQKKFISLKNYWSNDLNNGPEMCKYCSEIGADEDICVGDPWNLDLEKTDEKGTSLVVCRNPEVSELIRRSAELGHIKISSCSQKELVQSQGYHIEEKIKRGAMSKSTTRSSKLFNKAKRLIYLIVHPVEGFHVGSNIIRAVFGELKHLIRLVIEPDHYTLTYIACSVPIFKRLLKRFFINRVLIWYWREERKYINFGDYITQVLLKHFGYKTVNYHDASLLNILSNYNFCLLIIGSELNKQMVDWLNIPELYIWGQGKACGDYFDIRSEPYINKVRVFAVRGPHTVRQLNLNDETPLGDPAFLMPQFFKVKRDPSKCKITYVPHFLNSWGWKRKLKEIGAERYVDIMCTRSAFWNKLKDIVSSKFVLTNSLHTAIICNAYKVPWALCLAEQDELDKPDKWKDLFEFLGINNQGNAVKNYIEGIKWWEDIGSKTKTADLCPLLDSFPLPIRSKKY